MEARRPEPEPKAESRADPSPVADQPPPAADQPPVAGQPQPEGTGADLLTISLLVFFVSLLLIVAAMLVLPNIVH
jgi:hypothetical protein